MSGYRKKATYHRGDHREKSPKKKEEFEDSFNLGTRKIIHRSMVDTSSTQFIPLLSWWTFLQQSNMKNVPSHMPPPSLIQTHCIKTIIPLVNVSIHHHDLLILIPTVQNIFLLLQIPIVKMCGQKLRNLEKKKGFGSGTKL